MSKPPQTTGEGTSKKPRVASSILNVKKKIMLQNNGASGEQITVAPSLLALNPPTSNPSVLINEPVLMPRPENPPSTVPESSEDHYTNVTQEGNTGLRSSESAAPPVYSIDEHHMVDYGYPNYGVPPSFSYNNSHFLSGTEYMAPCDTGTCVPESGFFGFMISVNAMLGAATMYVRYKIVEVQNSRSSFLRSWFNLFSLLVGVTGCIGMGIVASFQESSVKTVHEIGALLTFVCGVTYILLQSIISYKSCPEWNKKGTCHIRMTISVVSVLAIFPMIACASVDGMTTYRCQTNEEVSGYHIASAICEWTVAFGFVTYFLTFIRDFKAVTLTILTEIHTDF